MAELKIGGQEIVLPPYKLGKLRRAAAFIDRINATAGALSTFEGMLEASRDICEVLSIGLVDFDPKFTADFLEDEFGLEDMAQLQECLRALMEESGLARKGEATALSAPATEGAASLSNSSGSSTSSSPPELKADPSAE